MSSEIKLFCATKAFIVHNNKVLILRESTKYKDGTQLGNYDVPGGRMKPGASWEENLLREVKEETGLNVRIGDVIAVSEWRPVVKGEQWQIVAMFFECFSDTDKVTLSEDHDSFLWIDAKEYKKYPMPPKNLPAFEKYVQTKQPSSKETVK